MTRFAVLTMAVLFMALAASAQPTVYYLQNVTFSDGGTASGTFTYDATTNRYSNVNVTTTAGTVRTAGATYLYVCGQDVPTCTGVFPDETGSLNLTTNAADQTGLPGFALFFLIPMSTYSGFDYGIGPNQLSSGTEANCSNASCAGAAAPVRFTTAGSIVQTEPSMLMLQYFGS